MNKAKHTMLRGRNNPLFKSKELRTYTNFECTLKNDLKVKNLISTVCGLRDLVLICEEMCSNAYYAIQYKSLHSPENEHMYTTVFIKDLREKVLLISEDLTMDDRMTIITKNPNLFKKPQNYEQFLKIAEDLKECANILIEVNITVIKAFV